MYTQNLHATCILLPAGLSGLPAAAGVLIAGPAGAGKSSLALRLLDRGGLLVSDDQTLIESVPEGLLATAPPALAGMIEIRGYGLLRLPPARLAPSAVIRLYVSLTPLPETAERLPARARQLLLTTEVPHMVLGGNDAAAPAKIFAALTGRLLDYTDM